MAIRTRKGKRRNRKAGSRDARGRIRGKINKINTSALREIVIWAPEKTWGALRQGF
jgi:hypothetical protein